MRKRLLSGLLALCLLVNVFPVHTLAEERTVEEQASAAWQMPAAEADWVLPVGSGAGLSLMGVESAANTCYLRKGSKMLFLEEPVLLPGVTAPPEYTMLLQVLDENRQWKLDSDPIDRTQYIQKDGSWYVQWINVEGTESLDAGRYYLQLLVAPVSDSEESTPAEGSGGAADGGIALADSGDIAADDNVAVEGGSTGAAPTFIPLDLQLQVIPADSLLMTKCYLTGFYSGVSAFDAYVYLEGFAEDDLNALQLQLVDENDQVVAQNTTGTGILANYMPDSCTLRLRMNVADGQALSANGDYRIAVNYDSSRTLYVSALSADVSLEEVPVIRHACISNAKDAAVTVDVDNFDPDTEYTITVAYMEPEGTFTGTLPADGVVEIPLGETRGLPITAYGEAFEVSVTWEGQDENTEWAEPYYLESPYGGYDIAYSAFAPERERVDVETFPFELQIPVSIGLLDETEITLQMSDGTKIGAASDISVSRSEGVYTIEGIMVMNGEQEEGQAAVFLNGEPVEDLELVKTNSSSTYTELAAYEEISTLFGEYRVRYTFFNGPETLQFQFRDSEGNVVLSSDTQNAAEGITPSYQVYDYSFTVDELQARLTVGQTYDLWWASSTDEDCIWDGLSYGSSAPECWYAILDNKTCQIGDDTLTMTVSGQNLDREQVEKGLILMHNETQVPLTVYQVQQGENPGEVLLTVALDAPLAEGTYRLMWMTKDLDIFHLSADSHPYVYAPDLRSGYLMAEDLSADAVYFCKVYTADACLMDLPLALEDGEPQYLYYAANATEALEDGTYYLRIYRDDVLFLTTEVISASAEEALLRVGGDWNLTTALLTDQVVLQVDHRGQYSYMRAAVSREDLEDMPYERIWNGSGRSLGVSDLPDGPVTVYVELATDLAETKTEIQMLHAYKCGSDYDLQTAVEQVLIPLGGDDYVLQTTTAHPYANVWASFTNGTDTAEVQLTAMGKQNDRGLFELTIPADADAAIPGSELKYSEATSVTLYAVALDDETKTPMGESVTLPFYLQQMVAILIFDLHTDGKLYLGKDQYLKGLATPNSTVQVVVGQNEYILPTDGNGLFELSQSAIGQHGSNVSVTIVDQNLGTTGVPVVVDTEAPQITFHIEADGEYAKLIGTTSDLFDLARFRIYRDDALLADLRVFQDISENYWISEEPIHSGCLFMVETYDLAGNVSRFEVPNGAPLTDTLSYTWDSNKGILRLHGSGELPKDASWPLVDGDVLQLELPEGLTRIPDEAFSGIAITELTIPNSDITIGSGAFSWCSDLRQVDLGGVTLLYGDAFNGCAMETIEIPASLTEIIGAPFEWCENLQTITVEADNPSYTAENGVLFNKSKNQLVRYPEGKTDTTYTVPDGVTFLCDCAFAHSPLTELTVSEGVADLGYSCFFDCKNLTTVHLPASMKWVHNLAFVQCPKLDVITLAEGCTSLVIENGCLYSADKTTLISCFDKDGITTCTAPETLTDLREGAFSNCKKLQSVVLTDAVNWIPWQCFADCTALTEVTIPVAVTSIDAGAFSNCKNLKTVWYDGTEDQWSVIKVAESNDVLQTAERKVPQKPIGGACGQTSTGTHDDNVTWSLDLNTGVLTFVGNGKLADFGEGFAPWFSYQESITTVVVEEGVTTVGNHAFYGLTNLSSVTLPKTLTSLGYRAFYGCTALTSIRLPKALNTIYGDCFKASGLTSVVYGGSKAQWDQIYNSDDLLLSITPEFQSNTVSGTINGTVTWSLNLDTGMLTIAGSGSLDGVLGIDEDIPWAEYRGSVTEVTIGKDILALDAMTYLGNHLNLKAVHVENGNHDLWAEDGVLYDCDSLVLYPPAREDAVFTISDRAVSLDVGAFRGNSHLTELTLPEGVVSIAASVFTGCSKLKTVHLPKTLTSIGQGAFSTTSNLTDVYYAGSQSQSARITIGSSNTPLTNAKWTYLATTFAGFGGTVTYEGITITEASEGLSAVILPTDLGITAIADTAFAGCTDLQYVVIPKTVTAIGSNAFPAKTILYGAAGSAAETYAKANGLTFAVPTVTLRPADNSTIGGKTATIQATTKQLDQTPLPLTLTYSGKTPLSYTEDVTGTTHKFTLNMTGMTDGEYTFTVANEAYGVSQSALYAVDVTPPAPIQNLRATGGNLQITLTWDPAGEANASSYYIYRAEAENGSSTEAIAILRGREHCSWVDNNVEPGKSYWYKICVFDTLSQGSAMAGPVTAAAHEDKEPPEIGSVSPENGSSVHGTMTLTVRGKDNIALQSITAEASADEKTWVSLGTVETDGLAVFSCDTTGYDQTLYIRLTAEDQAGNTAQGSTIYRYPVDNQAPAALTGLKLVKAQSTILTLGWDDVPDDDFACFRVERLDGEVWTHVRNVSDALGINLTGLTPNTSYTYRVCAVDQLGNAGEAAQITVSTVVDTSAPVITSLRPAPGSYNTSIPLSIQAADDFQIASLTIQLSQDGGKSWQDVHTVTDSDSASYSLDVSKMEEGVIRVRAVAVDAAGNTSDRSETAPYVEYNVDRTAPAAPQNLTATGGDGAILLQWSAAEEPDAAGYAIWRAEQAEGPFTCIKSNCMALSLNDNSVEYGKPYYYYLTVNDQTGNTSESSAVVSCQSGQDQTAPEILSVSPSGDKVVAVSAVVKVKASDNNRLKAIHYRWSEDNAVWNEGSVSMEEAVSETVQTLPLNLAELQTETLWLEIWCTDAVGRASETKTLTYTIDGTAPAVPDLQAELTDTGVALSWTASKDTDVAGYVLYRKEPADPTWQKLLQRSAGEAQYQEVNSAVECGKVYQYYLQVIDRCGNQADGESKSVSVPLGWVGGEDTTAPVARIAGSWTGTVGVELVFNGLSSRDDRAVTSYHWDFGDGAESHLHSPVHAFAEAGTYTVSLTVADEAGNENTATMTVEIKERDILGTLQVQVNDENGHGVADAGVYFDLGDDKQTIVYTNSMGQATLQVPVGSYPVGAYKDGYLPVRKDVEILSGTETAVTLVTVQKELVTGELTVRRMTLEEIRAAGIDVNDPANQEVFEFEIHLTYGTKPITIKTHVNGDGDELDDENYIEIEDEDDDDDRVVIWDIIPDPKPGPGPGGGNGGSGGGGYNGKVPTVVVLDIPGTASWLKDFFEVRMTVLNHATEAFYLDDCQAVLNVPTGLTLMSSNYTTGSAAVSMGTIQGQQSGTAYWILRGDKAGKYDLSADFSANLRDFNASVSTTLKTKESFEVRQGDGLSMELEVENTILADTDGALRIGLRNDHAEPYYLPNIRLAPDLVKLRRTFKSVGREEVLDAAELETLNTGETIWFEYIIPRDNWTTLTKRTEEDFYLHDAVVEALGGVTLPVSTKELPPCTISADKIVVKQRYDSPNGGHTEIPVDLILLNKEKINSAGEFPTLVIYTYALQEDGTYAPADMDVTIRDPGARNNEAGLTPTKEETGVYVYQQDSKKVYDNDQNYSIKISAARKLDASDTMAYSRCRPVEIPVTIRGATAKLTDIKVTVYGTDQNGDSMPMVGAQFKFEGGSKTYVVEDEGGDVQVGNIPEGYNKIRITKIGYLDLEQVIEVKSGGEYVFQMIQDTAPRDESKITYVTNTLTEYATGNITVIPQGKTTDDTIYFSPSYQLKDEADRFIEFRGRWVDADGNVKTDENGNKQEASFTGDVGFPVDMDQLEKGDRILFAVHYWDESTRMERTSPYTNSGLMVIDPPGFFENLVFSLSDMQHGVKLNPDKNFLQDLTSITEGFEIPSMGFGTKLESDNEAFQSTAEKADSGSFSSSPVKKRLPFAASYDPNGTLTLSVIFGRENEAEVSPDGFAGYLTKGLYRSANTTSVGGSAYLDFVIQYKPALDEWNLTVRGGVVLNQGFTLVKLEYYKLVYVSVKGEFKEELEWQLVETKVNALDTEDLWDFGPQLNKAAVSFELKAAGGVQAFSEDWASAGIYIRGVLKGQFVPSVRAEMEAALGGEARFLWFGTSKDWVTDTWTLYPLGADDYSLRPMQLMGTDQMTVTAMPKPVMGLMSDNPDLFADNVYGDADPRLVRLSDGRVMMIWLEFTGDKRDPTKVHTAIYENGTWTRLDALDTDGTPDLLPSVTATETGAVAVWTDSTQSLADMQSVAYETMAAQLPGRLGVSAAFYDGKDWSKPVVLKEGTAAHAPVAVCNGSRTMVAWIANDGNLDHSDASPEYIGWALLENGVKTKEGRVDADGLNLSELKLGVCYGQFQLAVLGDDGTTRKIRTADFEGNGWSSLTMQNHIDANDICLTYGADGALYYLNNGRIMRQQGGRSMQVLSDELLNAASRNLTATESGQGTILTWTTIQNSEEVVCMSLVDGSGTAYDPAVVLRGEDVLAENGGTAVCGNGVMLAAVTSREVDDVGLVYSLQTPVLSLQPDLVLTESGVIHQGTLYAGSTIVTSAYPESRGITASGGFTMTIHTADGTAVKREDFCDQYSASIHWTVPADYTGEPLYLTVTPLAGADQNMADNTLLLNNVVQEAALKKLTYAGKMEDKDAFLLTVENNGLTDLQDVHLSLKLLSAETYDSQNVGETKDRVLSTLVVERLEAGEARTVLLTVEEGLDLSQEQTLMAELALLPNETDLTDNRSYVTVYPQVDPDEEARLNLLSGGWFSGSEAVDALTGEAVTYRATLQNLGGQSAEVQLMAACYDANGKFLHLRTDSVFVDGQRTASVSVTLPADKLAGAAAVKAFVLDDRQIPLCEAGELKQSQPQ